MKKTLTIVGIIVLVALLGRVGWAYWQITKSDNVRVTNVPDISKYTGPDNTEQEIENLKIALKPTEGHSTSQFTETFTQLDGIYSASYPSDWKHRGRNSAVDQDQLEVFFSTTPDEKGASRSLFDIVIGVDLDHIMKQLSPSGVFEEITIGSNVYTKFTGTSNPIGRTAYILPIQKIGAKTVYISITPAVVVIPGETTFSNVINKSDLAFFLKSIRIDYSKASKVMPAIVMKVENSFPVTMIKAYTTNIRRHAEVYFEKNNTYVGACDGSNTKTQATGLGKDFSDILKIVSVQDVLCHTSNETYVYSVKMPGGETMCVDGAGFGGIISNEPKKLSCQ